MDMLETDTAAVREVISVASDSLYVLFSDRRQGALGDCWRCWLTR